LTAMANEIKITGTEEQEWSGMTIEELKYRRALALAKIEIEKGVMMNEVHSALNVTTTKGVAGMLVRRFFGKMTIMDYALIGFKLTKTLSKFWRSRRK